MNKKKFDAKKTESERIAAADKKFGSGIKKTVSDDFYILDLDADAAKQQRKESR